MVKTVLSYVHKICWSPDAQLEEKHAVAPLSHFLSVDYLISLSRFLRIANKCQSVV